MDNARGHGFLKNLAKKVSVTIIKAISRNTQTSAPSQKFCLFSYWA